MKKKKLKDELGKSILEAFEKSDSKPMNYKQVSKLLDIKDDETRKVVNKVLAKLASEKKLIEVFKGKYKLSASESKRPKESKTLYVGTVDMKQTGKAYVMCEDLAEDIMIMANNTNRSLHGDTVKVRLFPKRKDRQPEGEIIEVVKRFKNTYVGIVQISKNFAFVVPDNVSIAVDLFIPKENLNGAKNGEKAIAEIVEWPERMKNPIGKIIEVLGMPGNNDVEMHAILAEYGLPYKFDDDVEAEADKIPLKIKKTDIEKRRDFREITTFTIDPYDAKDFDDALSLRKLENGNWEIGVHIADVTHYVKPGTLIDSEGYNRATSVYLVDRCVPMLPEKLSNFACSLRPNEEKLCFSAVFEMNDKADVIDEWFGKTIINSDRRFTYEEVQEIIEKQEGEFLDEINLFNKLAKILRERRFVRGALSFDKQEVKFKLDESGKPLGVYLKEQKDSHKLIEEFMLLANRKVAELIGTRDPAPTFVYRVHNSPNESKLNVFAEFISKLGYKMNLSNKKTIANSFNKLLSDISGKGEENMIQTIAIRTMAKAYYTTKNIGHYGLSFDNYTHFTSPIRRYPDMMVHRLLELYLKNKPSVDKEEYETHCKHSSDMEMKAAEAERSSIKYKQVEFLSDKIGQEFYGLVSGVSKWGLYVEIDESKCEGMIRLRDIEDDFYYLDDENFCVVGERSGRKFKLGDRVKVKIARADLSRKQLDFMMVNDKTL